MNDLPEVTNAIPEEKTGEPEARQEWIFPASFAQRRLWFIDQVEPGSTLYNVPAAYRIRGRVEYALLERCFAEVIDRHEILRTTFRAVDGEPMQIVSSVSDFRLRAVDISALPAAGRDAEVSRVIHEESEHPFDLASGPLLRAALLDLGPTEQVLVLSFHHIITDSWSQEVLMRELTSAYASLAADAPLDLPELPIQYADFAAWQRDEMQGEVLEKDLRYWRDRLAGLGPLDLPQLPRQAQPGPTEGATFAFDLPAPLTAALRAMAQREGVTLFMALLAGWQAFLARYTGQTDIAVGSPISDRTRTETEGLIGLFINTLVLRTGLAGNPTVREALLRVRDTTLEAFAHQNLPFERMVETLQPARLHGKNPLLRVIFVLVSGENAVWRIPGATIESLPFEESKPKFDFMLHLRDNGRTIGGALVYDKALFTPDMVGRIAGHFQTLLSGMAAHPESRLNSLSLLLPEERERVLNTWNATAAPFPADRTVHSLFREHARLNPAAIAVEDGERRVTYGELDAQSDAIAGALIQHGVVPGDRVAIALPRSAQLIAGILGILKAGAAYVPLDNSYPASRLALMLRESGAKVLIGDAIGAAESAVPVLSMEACLAFAGPPPPDLGLASDAAHIMFTSGSTGVPKGVRILHRGINRLVINTGHVTFTPADVFAHASNISFDGSTFEMWGALLNGARLVIVPRETLLSPEEMAAFIRERKISVLFLTTPLFHHFAREIPGAFGTIRYLLIGGDALQPEAVRAVLNAARPAQLVNGYGPTECTAMALYYEVAEVLPGMAGIPIGRPIANTRAYVLDAALNPVPAGIAGEIYLGGAGVAGGYLNNPAGTAASFIADPFSDDPASRLYKTGDLARWREDGIMEFLGRADSQVKIRGFRVEPGEIEATLLRHPRIRQAIVLTQPDSTGQKQLAAYLVLHPGPALPSADLRAWLLAALPEYMVPAAFAFLDSLPLNANGKVDLPALAAHPLQEALRGHESPCTWMESNLVEIWEQILNRTPIGVTDDFFDLGGHSLLAIRMLAEVEKRTGIKIAARLLFEHPNIRDLAVAARRPEARTYSAMVPVQTGGALSPFFFLHGDFAEGGLYSVKMARLIGPDRPFYAIEPHGVHDAAPNSIEEMATARLELVRKVRPHGPYVLGGYCNGGLVAFEMARQLEAAGERVSSLILLSVDGGNSKFAWLKRLIAAFPAEDERKFRAFLLSREYLLFARASLKHHLDALRRPVPLARQPRRFARKFGRIFRKAFSLLLPHPPAPAAGGIDTTQPEAAGMDIALIYHQACMAYVPRLYRGPAHVIWPSEMLLRDPFADWGSVIPRVRLVPVPGDHFSFLQGDNLRIVSEKSAPASKRIKPDAPA